MAEKEKTIQALCEAVRLGLPRERAKDYGIDPEGPELRKAEAEFVLYHLQVINSAAKSGNGNGWKASAWLLERRFPAEYGLNRENTDDDGGAVDDGFIQALNDTAQRVFEEVE